MNRSVPVDTLLPHLAYVDVDEAVRWLSGAFGFSEHFRYGEPGSPDGAQLHLGDAWVMVFQAAGDGPVAAGQHGATLTVFVEDVDGHCARARAAGATITEEPNETVYGEYQYGAADLAGRHWLFARHARDVDPREWGATVAGNPPAP